MERPKVIEIKDASVIYPDGTLALTGINCLIEKGEFVFLIGPTGHGKTTLLKLIFRELLSSHGDVLVEGQNIKRLSLRQVAHMRRHIGFVFQDFRLLPNRTVWENVAFAMRVTGSTRKQIHRYVPELLCKVGLAHRVQSFPKQLSAGEQQRTAIARAICHSPDLLLADEPTGNLDAETGMDVMNILADINALGATVICATHNQTIVEAFKKRVISIHNGEIVSDFCPTI